jgi:hypothetical protein
LGLEVAAIDAFQNQNVLGDVFGHLGVVDPITLDKGRGDGRDHRGDLDGLGNVLLHGSTSTGQDQHGQYRNRAQHDFLLSRSPAINCNPRAISTGLISLNKQNRRDGGGVPTSANRPTHTTPGLNQMWTTPGERPLTVYIFMRPKTKKKKK